MFGVVVQAVGPPLVVVGGQMADSTPSGHQGRRAEEQADGDLPESTDNGEPDQDSPPDKAPTPRRVPGLHGYDPSQWPDTSI